MTHGNRHACGIRDRSSHRHVSATRQSGDHDVEHADVSRIGQAVGRCTCELRRWLCGAGDMAVSGHDANLARGWLCIYLVLVGRLGARQVIAEFALGNMASDRVGM